MSVDDVVSLFQFSLSPWELVLRGTVMYVFLFVIFRFVMRRDIGSIAISDVLLLVIVADASQNAMGGEYKTVSDGMVLVGTIVGLNWLLDWAAYRFAAVHRFLEAPPLLLVRHGRMLHRHLRREFLTPDDLMAELRKQGISDLREVREAYMEGDGHISVLRYDGSRPRALEDPHL